MRRVSEVLWNIIRRTSKEVASSRSVVSLSVWKWWQVNSGYDGCAVAHMNACPGLAPPCVHVIGHLLATATWDDERAETSGRARSDSTRRASPVDRSP